MSLTEFLTKGVLFAPNDTDCLVATQRKPAAVASYATNHLKNRREAMKIRLVVALAALTV
jgi:hypothetical protein